MAEQRKHERTLINRSIVYVGMNHLGQVEVQGVGRALDLSSNGMMFETPDPIYVDKLSIRISTNKGNSLEIGAQLIYTMPNSPGVYRTGVQFTGATENIEQFVSEMRNQLE